MSLEVFPMTLFFLALASTIITVRRLIQRAWTLYRWNTHPRSPRIRWPTGGRPES